MADADQLLRVLPPEGSVRDEQVPSNNKPEIEPALYWVSMAAGTALLAIGAAGVAFPRASSKMYGVPISDEIGEAYLRATAVRDIPLGGLLLSFAALGDRRALGLTFALGSLIAVGDGSIALRYSPYPLRVLPLHWGGVAAFCGLGYLLLRKKTGG